MTNLPPELVLILVDRDSTSTCAALALVNKHYNRVVTPILYEKIVLYSCAALVAFSDTLVNRCPILGQYPKSLHIHCYPGSSFNDPPRLERTIKHLLMRVPNIIDLRLPLNPPTISYLFDGSGYPFKLRRLQVIPAKNALFVEFLKTQPEIEHVVFLPDPWDTQYGPTPEWCEVSPTLEAHILPKLKSVTSDEISVRFLVPNHPVTSVSTWKGYEALGVHAALAKSSAPLECLSEPVELRAGPWETSIVSHLSSLKFCQTPLSEYMLRVSCNGYTSNTYSALTLFETTENAARGLAKIRECLSAFSNLRKFTLQVGLGSFLIPPSFYIAVPEFSQFDVWKESCPRLERVTICGITLHA